MNSKCARFLALCLMCLLIWAPLSACAPQEPADAIVLAQNKKSSYRVVVAADASADVLTMAEEFIDYFSEICGVKLPLVRDDTREGEREICIGKTARYIDSAVSYEKLGEEDYIYYTEDRSLLLTGGSDRGTAYAVYGFLEDYLGVRYYTPDYEKVPQSDTVQIPLRIEKQDGPVFWFRDFNEAGCADSTWRVKMRINSLQSLGSENYKKELAVGGGIGYADWFVHTIAKLAEMKLPEGADSFTNTQPCLSDENTYTTVLKNVRAWLSEYPEARIISISQNDGTREGSMCNCARCKAFRNEHGGVQSAIWVWFVGRIATELKDEYPGVYFDTLSYNFTRTPPKGVEVPDNMIIRYIPAHCCMRHSFATADDIYGTAPERASTLFRNNFDSWMKLTDNIFIWDYNALFYDYWSPQPDYTRLYENIREFAKREVLGVFIQGDASGSNGFSELRAYLVAKLLWNPNMSIEDYRLLIDDFLTGYYGAGTAAPLHDYIDYIEEKTRYTDFTLYGFMTDIFPIDTLTAEDGTVFVDTTFLDTCKGFFDAAESAFSGDEAQRLHLRKARIQIKYYEVMMEFEKRKLPDSSSIDYTLSGRLNEELYADLTACGVRAFSEGQAIPDSPNLAYAPRYWGR